MSQDLRLVATLDLQPDSWKKIAAVMKECVQQTRKEEGNLFYAVHFERGNHNRVVVIEHWASQGALDFHLQTDHFQNLAKVVEPYLECPMDLLFLNEIKE